MIALALVAVLSPSPLDHARVARVVPATHAAVGAAEEEPPREGRGTPEHRSWSAGYSPARNVKPASRPLAGPPRRWVRTSTPAFLCRGRTDHLREWCTPSALQVFRH
ncbi:hypothetical protein [Saccharothrix yanglingensis]|uniref:hypothetical protein n=1 Tax=Saccharothrix yanglingensis TaxID=659496 RepID=UPI0027D24D49|nr:hypothetical protein [Saccharothrix yanglingensis]